MTEQARNIQTSESTPLPAVSTAPTLCIANCGFFGSAKNANYCSKCYRDHKQKLEAEQKQALAPLATPAASPELNVVEAPMDILSPLSVPLQSNNAPSEISITTTDSTNIEIPITSTSTPSTSSTIPITLTSNAAVAAPASTDAVPALSPAPVAPSSTTTSSPVISSVAAPSSAPESSGKKKMKCAVCSKKLTTFTYVTCKCSEDKFFCASHRYPHAHSCTLDVKAKQAELLAKANPLVEFKKLEKI